MAETFPLDWPLGYKKTQFRRKSKFKQAAPDSIQLLLNAELRKLSAKKIIISSNIPVRRDGGIYADYLCKKMAEPGIAIYFVHKEQNVVICCDQYEYPWENMYALAKGIEALRGMDRWGVSEFMERAFTGFKALPESVEPNVAWNDVLGINLSSGESEIKSAYRKLAQIHHPDSGGTAAMFDRITKAYQQGIASLNH